MRIKMKNLNKYDKTFLLYLLSLFVFLLFTFNFNSLVADEGTHLLLSAFYKDLISDILQTKNFSFAHAYNFGINYLVHYPKLQIAYPPLYHLTTAVVFSLFGLSEFLGRLVNLLYAIGSFFIFYLLARKIFSSKVALMATIIFSFSPISLLYSSRALQDFSMYFFVLLATYIFSFSLKHLTKMSRKSILLFLSLGLTTFLAAMGKQMGGIIALLFLSVFLLQLFKLKSKKIALFHISLFLLTFLSLLLPYLFILSKVGGIEINKLVAIDYAAQQGEPTSLLDPYFWLWYLIQPTLTLSHFLPLFLASLIIFACKKEKNWKILLGWFILFYLSLTLIPNKEVRFSQLFLLPCYATTAFYLNKLKKDFYWITFLVIYVIISLYTFIPKIHYYPAREISYQIYNSLPEGGNVAVFSEGDPFFSSVLMWHLRVLDEKRKIQVFRACIFDNKTREEILQTIKDNNIHTIVYQTWQPRNIEELKPYFKLKFKVSKNGFTTEVYEFKDFQLKQRERICNFICLTRKEVCY
jgi:4-amino-4-deoxy-L-arabinose transferase-like glycosyltransferase